MEERRPPEVVRERVSRLTGSRIATAVVFDRDFELEELASFFRIAADDVPRPEDFVIEGRVARYECEGEDADRWRLALEIYLVKMLRDLPKPSPHHSRTGIRDRAGFRKLHLG